MDVYDLYDLHLQWPLSSLFGFSVYSMYGAFNGYTEDCFGGVATALLRFVWLRCRRIWVICFYQQINHMTSIYQSVSGVHAVFDLIEKALNI